MRQNRNTISMVMVLVMLVGLAIIGCAPSDDADQIEWKEGDHFFITFGTASAGGAFFPVCVGASEILTAEIEWLDATARTTPRYSGENIPQLESGDLEMAIIVGDQGYYAWHGQREFEGMEFKGTRHMMTGFPGVVQIIVREGKGLNSIEDLSGVPIGAGEPGSAQEATLRAIFDAYEIEFNPQRYNIAESAQALADGHLDAINIPAGIPTASTMELFTTHNVKLLSLDLDKIEKITEAHPYYMHVTIPAGMYDGQNSEVECIAYASILITHRRIPEGVVYEVVKTLYENLDRWTAVHPAARFFTLDNALNTVSIPMHPGVIRYLTEQGIDVPAAYYPPEMQ